MGRFWEDPSRFTKEYQGLTLSFDLTWKDLNIVLSHCCHTEEKTPYLGTRSNMLMDYTLPNLISTLWA